jgi:hypothetical protein
MKLTPQYLPSIYWDWKTKNFPEADIGGVQDLIVKSESVRERIFFGLDEGGVYEIIMRR